MSGGIGNKQGVILKTLAEMELIRQSGDLLGRAIAEVAKLIVPGVQTKT